MFTKKSKLQSSSEIVLRNIVVIGLIANYAIFLLYPVVMAFLGSFSEWNPLVNLFRMIGFDNYARLIGDKLFWSSMLNTFIFSFTVLVFRVGIGLLIAVAIYSALIKSKSFYRTLFYMPVVTPLVAIAFVWRWIYDPQIGLANQVLNTSINWLRNPNYAMGSVIFMTIWKDFGFAVVIFLAGLYSLPKDCYEAAYIDGGNARQVFWHITLPLLGPVISVLSILKLGNIFRGNFGLFYQVPLANPILTPVTDVLDTYIYRSLSTLGDFGMVTAASFYQSVLGLIVILSANAVIRKINPDNAMF